LSGVYTVRAGHVTERVVEESVGATIADKLIGDLQSDAVPAETAWLRFIEIAARQGWRSEGCRAFVLTLAKRAAGAGVVE
jgi:hypothetical protein